MDDIAAQVGMSKKTLYQHFADKDALVDDLVEGEVGLMQNETMECINSSANAIEEIFIDITKNVVRETVKRNKVLPATQAIQITTMAGCSAVK